MSAFQFKIVLLLDALQLLMFFVRMLAYLELNLFHNYWNVNLLNKCTYVYISHRIIYHRHWLDSPVWTLAFFRSFRQSSARCCVFSFRDNFFFPGWGLQPHAQPPAILDDQCFLSGLSLLVGWSQFGSVRNTLFALASLSRKNLAQESQRGRACIGLDRHKWPYPRFNSTHPPARCVPWGPHTTPLTPHLIITVR
jgi:hypothetical protein